MKILIQNDVAIKLRYYTLHADGEVSGLAKSERTEDDDILITDIALFEQECSAASTSLDVSAMSKFLYEMNKKGEDLSGWNVWWHTHGDLSAYWSSKDDDTIEEASAGSTHLISIVTNKDGDIKGRLDIFPKDASGFGKLFTGCKYDLDVEICIDEEIKKEVDKEVDALSKKKDKLKELLQKVDEKIIETQNCLLSDKDIDIECKKEIDEKVKKKEIKTRKLIINKSNGYYTRDPDDTDEFENELDNIANGRPYKNPKQTKMFKNFKYQMCPECQNPIINCICKDAIEKYGDILADADDYESINGYIANQFKEDDYNDDEWEYNRYKS